MERKTSAWANFQSTKQSKCGSFGSNRMQAKRVLERNMSVSTALPCRIAVYEENDHVPVATMLPTQMLALFSVPELAPVAQEVEREIKAMIDEATQLS